MAKVRRPRIPRAEDRQVVSVESDDVAVMLAACVDWQERLCLAVLAYLGPRRTAAANLRWRDVDMRRGIARFREKGGKAIAKPIPDELHNLFVHARLEGVPSDADDYVIPNRRAASVQRADKRSSKIVYETVQRVAARCGIEAHAHSFRAAYAVQFLRTHPGEIEALQNLLGHTRIDTTTYYLRKLRRDETAFRVTAASRRMPLGPRTDPRPPWYVTLSRQTARLRAIGVGFVNADELQKRIAKLVEECTAAGVPCVLIALPPQAGSVEAGPAPAGTTVVEGTAAPAGWTWPFGNEQGKAITEVSTKSLQWFVDNYEARDAKWEQQTKDQKAWCRAELARRGE